MFDEEDLQLYVKPSPKDKASQSIFKAEPGYSMLISVVSHYEYVLTVDTSVIKYRDSAKKKKYYCEECIILYVKKIGIKKHFFLSTQYKKEEM